MFFGRQVGHVPTGEDSVLARLAGGVAGAVVAGTDHLRVIYFPDGRLPSPRWRLVAALVAAVTLVCAGLSALWPVEYASAGIDHVHPVNAEAPDGVTTVWSALAHPSMSACRSSGWSRWRLAGAPLTATYVASWPGWPGRRRLRRRTRPRAGGWGTPVPGLLAATLMPVAAGWAVVHGQHVDGVLRADLAVAERARARTSRTDVARAAAEALGATGARLWMGPGTSSRSSASGRRPARTCPRRASSPSRVAPDHQVRAVPSHGGVVGALSIDRRGRPSLARRGADSSTTSRPRPRSCWTTRTVGRHRPPTQRRPPRGPQPA